MLTNFFRSFIIAFKDLGRHFGIFIGTIFVLFISLSLMSGLFLLKGITENLIASLKEKADLSVYFLSDAKEEEMVSLKETIERFPEVSAVEYVSKEKALKEFKEKRGKDPLFSEALEMIGFNPLPASLNIKANSASAFKKLANFLEEKKEDYKIDKVNYADVEVIIKKLFSFSDNLRSAIFVASIILAFISCFMILYTIRLSIYSRREEIQAMKLIGATNWFVRGPFLIQGLLIGFFGGILSFLLFFALATQVSPSSLGMFAELGFLSLIQNNILVLLGSQILGGMLFGGVATFFALQKYLKV